MSNIASAFNRLVSRRMYDTSRTIEIVEYLSLALIGIFIPFLLQHPQLLVGSVVNFVLIMAAINVKGWGKIISLIVLPSISALLGTYLFGPFKVFLLYMIPFIWIGNAVLVFVFKWLFVQKRFNYAITLPIAAVLKAGFLYCMALVLIEVSVIPAAAAPVFAQGMGIVQLGTALIGGLMAFAAGQIYKNLTNRKAN